MSLNDCLQIFASFDAEIRSAGKPHHQLFASDAFRQFQEAFPQVPVVPIFLTF